MKRRASSVALEVILQAIPRVARVNVPALQCATFYSSGTVKRALAELIEQGKVERTEPGFYRRTQ